MIAGLIPLLIIGGLVAGAVALARRTNPVAGAGLMRLLVTAAFTLATAIIAAVGVAQLLELAFETGDLIAGRSATNIARAVSLTGVGLPTFIVLWRYLLRTLDRADRSSLVWSLYLATATAVFGIGAIVGLGNGLAWVFGWNEFGAGSLATGLAWGLMAAWHEWHRVSVRPPHRLGGIPVAVGSTIGLVVGAVGIGTVVSSLLDRAYQAMTEVAVAQSALWDQVGEGAIWTVLGAALWWWHWLHDLKGQETSVERSLYLLVPGSAGGAVVCLSGTGGLLFTVLQHFFGDGASSAAAQFNDLPGMLTAIGLGFVVWRYHRAVALGDPEVAETEVGYSYRFVLGGLALVAAATGFGVVVNGLLAAATPSVAGEAGVDLLLGGIAALVVGAPVWWLTWRPRVAPTLAEITSHSRRIYLTVLAGVGGVTALVSLILVIYRVLESVLEGDTFGVLVDRSRASFGVLAATGLVAAYHVTTWRRERRQLPEEEHAVIRRVTVVTTHPEDGMRRLGKDLGVPVVTMHSGGTGRVIEEAQLAEYLRTLEADEAVVIEEETGYRVIRITED